MSEPSERHVRLVFADGTVLEYERSEEPPDLDEEDLRILERICDEAGRARARNAKAPGAAEPSEGAGDGS